MAKYDWQYDELRQIGVDYDSEEEVARYDARMQRLRDIPAEISGVLEATGAGPSSLVLEIGCGTGQLSLALAEQCRQVHAVDISAAMLGYASKKAADRALTNIDFHHGGFLSCPEFPEKFDIIISQLALHHLPDFWKAQALTKVSGLLKPAGIFFLRDVVYPAGLADYDSHFSGIIGGVEAALGPEFTKEIIGHIKQEYSTLDWIMEGLLTGAGLTVLETAVENDFIYTYRCTNT